MSTREQTELNAALEHAKAGDWELANDILRAHGIEFVSCAGKELKYINRGDTYDATICEDQETGEIFIGSWGGWYEETEQKYCEEEGMVRCGYCSEFTPMDQENWRDVICEHCGNCVAG